MSNEYETGMGTTPGMWEMASEALHGEKLPVSLNSAIHALAEGRATVVLKQGADGEAHDVVLATVRVMTKALDELASACTDETGAVKAPDKKALMKARAMLPSWCANSLTKPAAKQA